MVSLRRTALLAAMALTVYAFAGCGGSTSSHNSTSSQMESKTTPLPQTHDDDFYIKWAIPDSISISDQVNEKVNALLDSKYGLGVRFVPISDIPGEIDYHSELKKADVDIAFTGFDTDDDKPCERLISEGYFAPLDDMLKGSELYSLIPKQLWETTGSNGSIYTIPNETSQDIGVCIVFDLDKIPAEKAKAFDGDIQKLPELLGDSGKLFYGIDGFSFAEYLGQYYDNGLVISDSGKAENPTQNKDCLKWLKLFNSLYTSSKADDSQTSDWSIAVTKDPLTIEKQNIYTYKTKSIIGYRCSATTGILQSSKNKQRAFRLLEAVHTDSELANLLVFGGSFTEKDGYAYDENGELMSSFLGRLIFGADTNVLKGADRLMSFEGADEKKAYYNKNVIVSPLAGIDICDECKEINTVMNKYRNIWKSKDLDSDIAALNKELSDAGTEDILSSINEKIKQGAKK